MRIAVAQLNYHIGNFEGNYEKMRMACEQAIDQNADLVCFSELATCGYPPRDFLEFNDFIVQAEKCIDKLKILSKDIAIAVGSPSRNPVVEGKDLFNSAYFLYEGEIVHKYDKGLLPTYDIFDEYRYFEPAKAFEVLEFKGRKIALTICEDIWNIGNENPLYTTCPMDEMIDQSPEFVINLSASPFDYNHAKERYEIVKENVNRYKIPFIYINHVGAQTEIIFDGGSILMSGDGSLVDELPFFEEALRVYDIQEIMRHGHTHVQDHEKIEVMHDAIILGIRDYFGKLGFKKAILGLSGGIDSALTAALAVKALGPENVYGVLMPSEFSSDHSIEDARQLAINLGIRYDIIPIKEIFDVYMNKLDPMFKNLEFNVTEENIQARARGILLMALSNKFGYILLNTTNKSEMAVGYGTLYGDLCGGLSVIGDVYKTEVYSMSEFINRDQEFIPKNTISKPPSAELRPNQKDSDSLPEYEALDPILFEYIENRMGPKELIAMGHDEALVRRILRLVNINEFKRYQTAPVLRVSPKAFGVGRRMPIVGKYLS
jgi:NAD+ synthase (glutamine-hydrolysing)